MLSYRPSYSEKNMILKLFMTPSASHLYSVDQTHLKIWTESEDKMKENPFNMLKLGVIGCATLIGVNASVLPVTSAETTKQTIERSSRAPITALPNSIVGQSHIHVKEKTLKSVNANLDGTGNPANMVSLEDRS